MWMYRHWPHNFPSDIPCMLKLVKSGGLLQNRKEESSEAFTLSFLKEYTCVCVCVCARACPHVHVVIEKALCICVRRLVHRAESGKIAYMKHFRWHM